MEFLLIGESKLKIVLNEEETKNYKLDGSCEDSGGAGVRRSFWRILEMAKQEVGFDPAGDKVLIQFYPIKTGGCEVFVTKLGILPDSSARLVSRSNRISLLSKNRIFYLFYTLEDLIRAARAVKQASGNVSINSDVYLDDDKYYMSVEEYAKGGEPVEFPCILEFGVGLTADFGLYISEHADPLAEGDGIERFCAL